MLFCLVFLFFKNNIEEVSIVVVLKYVNVEGVSFYYLFWEEESVENFLFIMFYGFLENVYIWEVLMVIFFILFDIIVLDLFGYYLLSLLFSEMDY